MNQNFYLDSEQIEQNFIEHTMFYKIKYYKLTNNELVYLLNTYNIFDILLKKLIKNELHDEILNLCKIYSKTKFFNLDKIPLVHRPKFDWQNDLVFNALS